MVTGGAQSFLRLRVRLLESLQVLKPATPVKTPPASSSVAQPPAASPLQGTPSSSTSKMSPGSSSDGIEDCASTPGSSCQATPRVLTINTSAIISSPQHQRGCGSIDLDTPPNSPLTSASSSFSLELEADSFSADLGTSGSCRQTDASQSNSQHPQLTPGFHPPIFAPHVALVAALPEDQLGPGSLTMIELDLRFDQLALMMLMKLTFESMAAFFARIDRPVFEAVTVSIGCAKYRLRGRALDDPGPIPTSRQI